MKNKNLFLLVVIADLLLMILLLLSQKENRQLQKQIDAISDKQDQTQGKTSTSNTMRGYWDNVIIS